jgi:putative heme utilization carrier protein HutX
MAQPDQAAAPDLAGAMAADPGALFEDVARRYGASLRDTVGALPGEMRRFAAGQAFAEVLGEVARWGDVVLIIHTDDGVMEFTGPVRAGTVSRGYYNIPGPTGFHGHLKHERCAEIGFVERPFFGRPQASILFFNVDGGIMFKIFVARDEKRELLADQLASFRALVERLAPA